MATENSVPQQQQTPIGSKSSEELALLLGEQYKLIMQCQNNIVAISSVIEQRRKKSGELQREVMDGK